MNLDPEVGKAIRGIVDERTAQLRAEAQRFNSLMGNLPRTAEGARQQQRASAAFDADSKAIQRRAEAEALRLLTKKQRAKYKAMLGESFDFEPKAVPSGAAPAVAASAK